MRPKEIECPNCGAVVPIAQGEKEARCDYCGGVLDLFQSLCPECGFLHLAARRACIRCKATIVRACPNCREDNWAGLEQCSHCGRPLDLLEIMSQSRVRDTRARLGAQQEEVFAIKEREAAQSEARMAKYREMERQRLEGIAVRSAQQRRREQLLLRVALLVVAVVLVLMLVVSVLPSLMGQ